ncbi:MAG: cation:proton antiporter, partial [Flavobacteriales bacterium]
MHAFKVILRALPLILCCYCLVPKAVIASATSTQSVYFSPGEPGAHEAAPGMAADEAQEEEHADHNSGTNALFFIIMALFISAATRHFLKKLPFPFTVLLMLFGLALGILGRMGMLHTWHLGTFQLDVSLLDQSLEWAAHINPHLLLFIFLPILIFEAAFAMDVHIFKKTVANATILAVPGIIISLLITGALVYGIDYYDIGLDGWANWGVALMFGAVISATDPVAVVALLKDLGASKKLGTLIEGESMLNDGTAIVLFMVFLSPMI